MILKHWTYDVICLTKLNCSNKYKTQAFGQGQYSSGIINSILLLFLLFLVSSRVAIVKNFSSHSWRRTLQAADFFLYLPQITRFLLKNNLLFKFPSLLTRRWLSANPSTWCPFSSASHVLCMRWTLFHKDTQKYMGNRRVYTIICES